MRINPEYAMGFPKINVRSAPDMKAEVLYTIDTREGDLYSVRPIPCVDAGQFWKLKEPFQEGFVLKYSPKKGTKVLILEVEYKRKERSVWLETSNAFVGTDGQREGGHVVTGGAQHWILTVGDYMYQAGNVNGMNIAMGSRASGKRAGKTEVGKTKKMDQEIALYIAWWNKEGGGALKYDLLGNSCQTFGMHFGSWLTDGQGKLPNQGGASVSTYAGGFSATAGMGEVACASAGGAKMAVSGPAAGVQGIKGHGAFIQAEMFKAEAGTDTPLGHVGVQYGPNINTGIGMRNGNAEASILGFGGKVGKDGVGVRTPLAGADCSIM